MKQRFCECGCGRPVNPYARGARLSIECGDRRYEERKEAWNTRRKERDKQAKERRALDPHSRRVSSQFSVIKARSQRCCHSCGGQPWAREVDREDDRGRPVAIIPPYVGAVTPAPVCRRCGEAYSAEPPVPRPDVLGSSAGMAVRAAAVHGLAADPQRHRPSRAKVAS
jgi:hypothetical protein